MLHNRREFQVKQKTETGVSTERNGQFHAQNFLIYIIKAGTTRFAVTEVS